MLIGMRFLHTLADRVFVDVLEGFGEVSGNMARFRGLQAENGDIHSIDEFKFQGTWPDSEDCRWHCSPPQVGWDQLQAY